MGDKESEEAATGKPGIGNKPVAASRQASKGQSQGNTFVEAFFADVEQYYLQTLYETSKKEYVEEVKSYRASHKTTSDKCFGYQALTLEYVKHCLDCGDTAADADLKKGQQEAPKLLTEMLKVRSPYRQDAADLLRKLKPGSSVAVDKGFEDLVTAGDAAVEKKDWAEAIKNYEQATAACAANIDKHAATEKGGAVDKAEADHLALLENTLVGCYHNLAAELCRKNKAEEGIAIAKETLKKYVHAKAAPGLAVFLLNAQYYQYQAAADRTDEEKTVKGGLLAAVTATAHSILKWRPDREEGDAARVILLRLALEHENLAEADKQLSDINPKSKEYPKALTVMGFAHWSKYKAAKKQLEADQAAKVAIAEGRIAKRDADRKQAVEYTQKAVEGLDTPRTPEAPVPELLRECQLLLAEIYLEGADFQHAAAIYKPLIDDILKDPQKRFDETALRIFNGAGQAYLKLGDVENITAVGANLVDRGPDAQQVNRAIMSFARAWTNNARRPWPTAFRPIPWSRTPPRRSLRRSPICKRRSWAAWPNGKGSCPRK